MISKLTKRSLEEFLKTGERFDGRKVDDFRKVKIELGVSEKAEGSALVTLGETQIAAGIKLDVGEPFPDTPEQGVLITNAELTAMSSEIFEPGPPGENAIEVARVVDRCIREAEVIDLEKVSPLFNMPACILKCRKGRTSYPIKGIIYSGHLPRKNVSLGVALKHLNVIQTKFHLHTKGTRSVLLSSDKTIITKVSGQRSAYYDRFKEGARLDPRPLWFVDIEVHPKLGLSRRSLPVKTSSRAIERAKAKFKDVKLLGLVESDFLFGVFTGSELIPFGHLAPALAIVPVVPERNGYRIITAQEAEVRGYFGLARWLKHVERIWQKKLGSKASKMNVYQWLNYWNQLSSQNPQARYKVLYTAQGTYLASCVVATSNKTVFIDGVRLRVRGFIADITTFWLDINEEDEAYYICAILNAPFVDSFIKPYQVKGAFGARKIDKRPLELPIPKFDPDNPIHKRLAQMGKECHQKVQKVLPALTSRYKSIGKIRSEIRKYLAKELDQIDQLTRQLLGLTYDT